MASVMQVLMHTNAFKKRYNNPGAIEYRQVRDPAADMLTQMYVQYIHRHTHTHTHTRLHIRIQTPFRQNMSKCLQAALQHNMGAIEYRQVRDPAVDMLMQMYALTIWITFNYTLTIRT